MAAGPGWACGFGDESKPCRYAKSFAERGRRDVFRVFAHGSMTSGPHSLYGSGPTPYLSGSIRSIYPCGCGCVFFGAQSAYLKNNVFGDLHQFFAHLGQIVQPGQQAAAVGEVRTVFRFFRQQRVFL